MTTEGFGNDGRWTAGKTNRRFSSAAHRPWKSLHDSHIPAAPVRDRRGKVEIQAQDSHFPTACSHLSNQRTKGDHPRLIA